MGKRDEGIEIVSTSSVIITRPKWSVFSSTLRIAPKPEAHEHIKGINQQKKRKLTVEPCEEEGDNCHGNADAQCQLRSGGRRADQHAEGEGCDYLQDQDKDEHAQPAEEKRGEKREKERKGNGKNVECGYMCEEEYAKKNINIQ